MVSSCWGFHVFNFDLFIYMYHVLSYYCFKGWTACYFSKNITEKKIIVVISYCRRGGGVFGMIEVKVYQSLD